MNIKNANLMIFFFGVVVGVAFVSGGAAGTAVGGGERQRFADGLVDVGADVSAESGRQRRSAVAGVARQEARRFRRRQGSLAHADQNDDGTVRLSSALDR